MPVKIVVGIDGSPSSVLALQWADGQARLTGAELHAVIAWNPPTSYGYMPVLTDVDWGDDARTVLEKAIHETLGRDEARVHRHVINAHPALTLLNEAADADRLVVGSRGHGGFTGLLLGSVSQHAVTHAHCPVVVVRAPDHQGVTP